MGVDGGIGRSSRSESGEPRARAAEASHIQEQNLAVLGFEFTVAFEEGVWRAVAWKVAAMEREDTYPTLEEVRSASGKRPRIAFNKLYDELRVFS